MVVILFCSLLLASAPFSALQLHAQLPVRTRQLQLISNNNTNYTLVRSVDGQVVNWSLILPPSAGSTGSLLTSTVAGSDATMGWLAPGANGSLLTIAAGVPAWTPGAGLFWALTGNSATTAWNGAAGNFVGTSDDEDLVLLANNTFGMKIIGDDAALAGADGRVIFGQRTLVAGIPGAAQAEERVNILGGNLRFDSEGSAAITREIIFDGTSGAGNFRIAGDGGDIVWQGGGGNRLQMASYWGIRLIGNRGVGGAPAFSAGAATDASVNIIGTRTTAPILVTTPPAALTANQQEWRNSASTALSIVDSDGDFGIGVTAALSAKLQIQATSSTGNGIQLDPWGVNPGNTTQIRFRELAAGGANYVAFRSPDALAADNLYTLPNGFPAADDYVMTSTAAGVMSWQDPLTLIDAWYLNGNSNAVAGSFIGPTNDNVPMNIATVAGVPGNIRFYIGSVAPADLRMELSDNTFTIGDAVNNVNTTMNGSLTVTGTAGTPNVRLVSLSGAAGATIPVGFDRVVLADVDGDLHQVGSEAFVETFAWSLTGNAVTNPATNYLGTTDAQGLSIRTGGTEAIRINTSQQVGIGTSAPSQLLEVEDGNVLISTSALGTVGSLRWEEAGANGNNYVAFQPAAALANDNTYTLPSSIGAANTYLRIASAPAPTATTATLEWAVLTVVPNVETFNVTVDNQAIAQAGTTTFLRLSSDGVAANRTVTLADGTTQGHVMVIRVIGNGSAAYGVELADGANLELSGGFNMNDGDTITLIWDGTDWFETGRRNN